MSNKFDVLKKGYKIFPQNMLGRGAFGEVYQGLRIVDKSKVAIKIINADIKAIQKQIGIMLSLKHQNVVQIVQFFSIQNFSYIISQKCDGDLSQLISFQKTQNNRPLTQNQCFYIIIQICNAFKYLSQKNIIHRDLKPQNIFIKDGQIKVGDFGVAKVVESESYGNNTIGIGSNHYKSFQLLTKQPYTSKCDVWSLGCIFYQLLHGNLPWSGINQKGMIENFIIQKLKQSFNIQRKDLKNDNTKKFLLNCLQIQQHHRSSWRSLLKDLPSESSLNIKMDQFQQKVKNLLKGINIPNIIQKKVDPLSPQKKTNDLLQPTKYIQKYGVEMQKKFKKQNKIDRSLAQKN